MPRPKPTSFETARGGKCLCPRESCKNMTADPKWVRCRPCAVGNHTGLPCSYYEQARFQIDSCRNCGFDFRDHG